MTLNNCASMKLEVHFQSKQVSHGKGGAWGLVALWGNPGYMQTTCKSSSRVLGLWGVQSSALV